jgi:hypothetical protein
MQSQFKGERQAAPLCFHAHFMPILRICLAFGLLGLLGLFACFGLHPSGLFNLLALF